MCYQVKKKSTLSLAFKILNALNRLKTLVMKGSCLFSYTFINNYLCNYKVYYLSNTLLWNQQGDHKKQYFIRRRKTGKKIRLKDSMQNVKCFIYLLLFYTAQLPAILAGSQMKKQRTGTNWKKNPHYSEKSFNHPCQKPRGRAESSRLSKTPAE